MNILILNLHVIVSFSLYIIINADQSTVEDMLK